MFQPVLDDSKIRKFVIGNSTVGCNFYQTKLIPAGCAVGTSIILNIALNFVSGDAEAFISNLAAKAGNAVKDKAAHVREWIQNLEVKENVLEALSTAKQKTSSVSNEVGQKIQATYKRITH